MEIPSTQDATSIQQTENQNSQSVEKTKFNKNLLAVPLSILVGCLIITAGIIYGSYHIAQSLGLASLGSNTQVLGAATGTQTQPSQPAPATPVNITLKPGTPFLGNDSAKVTVVEFADYQCPFCEQFFKTVYPDLKTKYIDTGKIKFVYQDFAFLGPDSTTAAEASHCAADQNKFWQYHDYLFNNQKQENSGWATTNNLEQFAQILGLNSSQFNQCMSSGKYSQEVASETAAGRSYGVNGTPTVFVNGKPLVGIAPAGNFEQAIEAALAK